MNVKSLTDCEVNNTVGRCENLGLPANLEDNDWSPAQYASRIFTTVETYRILNTQALQKSLQSCYVAGGKKAYADTKTPIGKEK